MEEVSNETPIKQTDFEENISEFLPPKIPQIKSNPISQSNSRKAKIIFNETLIKEYISTDTLKPSDRHIGFPTKTPTFLRRCLEIIPGALSWALT